MASNCMHPAEYMRNRRRNRRLKFIQLLGGKCQSCGSIEDLQFDHTNPRTKKFDFNQIKDSPESIISKELKKCTLLCRECHLAKTKANNEHVNRDKKPSTHGSIWHYKKFKCRCDKCRAAMSAYLKNKR